MSSSSDKPHPRQLELRWIGEGTPTPLSQRMIICGTEGCKWLLLEPPSPGKCMHEATAAYAQQPENDLLDMLLCSLISTIIKGSHMQTYPVTITQYYILQKAN